MPTEDLGDPFLKILRLLKILATHSCRFYAYWRSWRVNGDWFLLYSFLFHSNFQKILFLLRSKKDHARVYQFGDLRNGVIWNGMIIWNAVRKLITSFWKKKTLISIEIRKRLISMEQEFTNSLILGSAGVRTIWLFDSTAEVATNLN